MIEKIIAPFKNFENCIFIKDSSGFMYHSYCSFIKSIISFLIFYEILFNIVIILSKIIDTDHSIIINGDNRLNIRIQPLDAFTRNKSFYTTLYVFIIKITQLYVKRIMFMFFLLMISSVDMPVSILIANLIWRIVMKFYPIKFRLKRLIVCIYDAILIYIIYFFTKPILCGYLLVKDNGYIIYIDLNNRLLLNKFQSDSKLLQELGNTQIDIELILHKDSDGNFYINSEKIIDNKVFLKKS